MNGHHLAELNVGRLLAPVDTSEAFGWDYLKNATMWKSHGCQVAAE